VHLVVSGERETRAHVLIEERGLVGLDVLDKGVVNGLLEGGAIGGSSLLLVFVEYVSALGLGRLVLEGGISDAIDLDASDTDLGAGGDGVHLVDALHGHAVDLEGSAHEEETGFELLKENNSSSAESTSSEDEHATGLDALAQLGGACLLSTGLTFLVLSGVPIELLDH